LVLFWPYLIGFGFLLDFFFLLVLFWHNLIEFGFLIAFFLLFWFCFDIISLYFGYFWPSLFYFGIISLNLGSL
jgi:hypothetical protein